MTYTCNICGNESKFSNTYPGRGFCTDCAGLEFCHRLTMGLACDKHTVAEHKEARLVAENKWIEEDAETTKTEMKILPRINIYSEDHKEMRAAGMTFGQIEDLACEMFENPKYTISTIYAGLVFVRVTMDGGGGIRYYPYLTETE